MLCRVSSRYAWPVFDCMACSCRFTQHVALAPLTRSIVGPKDEQLTIIGYDRAIFAGNVRDDAGPVYVRHIANPWDRAIERGLNPLSKWWESCFQTILWSGMGIACPALLEVAEGIQQQRPSHLSLKLGLHITELLDDLQRADKSSGRRRIQSTCAPIWPLSWATRT